jgi:hypothetical protein
MTVHELHGAILVECYRIRSEVESWDLDEMGKARVSSVVTRIEKNCATDVQLYEQHGSALASAVEKRLEARYDNLRALPEQVQNFVKQARACEWLDGWYNQAESDPSTGLGTVTGSSKRHAQELKN